MKIVVNNCYGGFGLSAAAIVHYLKLKGLSCFFYTQKKYKHSGGKDLYVRITQKEAESELGIMFTFTKGHGVSFEKWPKEEGDGYFYDNDLKRDDPFLVQTVEELGVEKASGRLSKLRIVEIPDDIVWYIDEYDGIESVHENHRRW